MDNLIAPLGASGHGQLCRLCQFPVCCRPSVTIGLWSLPGCGIGNASERSPRGFGGFEGETLRSVATGAFRCDDAISLIGPVASLRCQGCPSVTELKSVDAFLLVVVMLNNAKQKRTGQGADNIIEGFC